MAAKRLTLKQAKFVEAYTAIGQPTYGNGVASARAAGYKGSDDTLATVAKENIRKPQIACRLADTTLKDTTEVKLTTHKVLRDLEEARRGAIEDRKWSAAARIGELQGKYLRMWVERIEHLVVLEDVPDNELDRLIAEATSELAQKKETA